MNKRNSLHSNEIVPPCDRDCPDRNPGCGAVCPRWAAYVEKRNARYAERLKEGENRQMTQRCRRREVTGK